jgi:uncharacterized cupredoxin-like copper-binding protein
VVFALSTSHKIGLGLVAAAFIAFAIVSALIIPRYRPDWPGPRGVKPFVAVTILFFLAMMAAVFFFGREPKEEAEAATGGTTPAATTSTSAGTPTHNVRVIGVEFAFKLSTRKFSQGSYVFDFANNGHVPHNLTITGPGVNKAATPTIAPNTMANLKVTLKPGTYDLYCSVPGHKQAGMNAEITVS